ncbi:hypothetical protein [Streptomyces sp. V3I7]|uniref:hypothetical protein n=1 Tax=Streptomyces sp. V3I7 TaxID=3042278 RepID=UPI0027832E0F|nr:hypothetical protein [Streptomyces sp. V3I7]MDQ0992654.1 hypothetical protein [Streptomyces sp. V3I7]
MTRCATSYGAPVGVEDEPTMEPEPERGPCGHWQSEEREGKTHCRDCHRQLYL